MHGYWFGSYGWVWMVVSILFWLALIGGVIWLVIWAARRSSSGNTNSGMMNSQMTGSPSAKEIAQMRYARGEISREAYQQLLEDLSR